MKFLDVRWSGSWQDITSIEKDKLLHLSSPTTEKEEQYLVGNFESGQHIPHLGILLQSIQSIYYVTWNTASVEWAKSKKGLCSRSRLQCEQPCHLDHKSWQTLG